MEVTTKLAQEGKIESRTVKDGAKLYLPGDAPSQLKGVPNKSIEEYDFGKDQEGGGCGYGLTLEIVLRDEK